MLAPTPWRGLFLAALTAVPACAADTLYDRAARATEPAAQIELGGRLLDDGLKRGDAQNAAVGHLVRGEGYLGSDQLDAALRDAQEGLAGKPGDFSLLQLRSDVRVARGDCPGALADMDAAAAGADGYEHAMMLKNRAALRRRCGAAGKDLYWDYLEAVKAVGGGEDPARIAVSARRGLGEALCEDKKFDDALAQFAAAVKLAPEDAQTRLQRGLCLDDAGRAKAARAEYDRGLALIERRPGASKSKVSENDAAYYVIVPDANVVASAYAGRAAQRAKAGDAKGALADADKGAARAGAARARVPEAAADRRRLAALLRLRARLRADKGRSADAQADRDEACRWEPGSCAEASPKARP